MLFGVGYYQSMVLFRDTYKMTFYNANQLIKVFVLLDRGDSISYSILRAHFGLTSGHSVLPDCVLPFFLAGTGLRTSLSSLGIEAFSYWITSLRRVLSDDAEFNRLTVGYITKAEKDKRRLKQRFWALSVEEQVKILRDYFCLPFRDDAEKKIRHDKRIEIFKKYDLRNTDLTNAINRHGLVVKSVRCSAEYRHLFPDYVPGEWGKRRNAKPKQDDLLP